MLNPAHKRPREQFGRGGQVDAGGPVMPVQGLDRVVDDFIEHRMLAVQVQHVEPAAGCGFKDSQVAGPSELPVLVTAHEFIAGKASGKEYAVRAGFDASPGEAGAGLGQGMQARVLPFRDTRVDEPGKVRHPPGKPPWTPDGTW